MIEPEKITLYSGGLIGAETEFGLNAERWGIKEVTYSFEGHRVSREKNVVILNEEELKRGDISMEILSKHMGRTYTKAEKIRRVIQSLFHLVNSGYQVFVVGWILEDDTVKGGTGWAVELGKLFNRPMSVYDQGKNKWFSWTNRTWTEDVPVISHKTFTGTGTRNLTEEGREAIADLFKRSFGATK